jgi:hypothetical protein
MSKNMTTRIILLPLKHSDEREKKGKKKKKKGTEIAPETENGVERPSQQLKRGKRRVVVGGERAKS